MELSWEQPRWIALYTRPRTEKQVYRRLIQKKIRAYLPLIKTLRRWSDRRKWIETPLFTSYVFANVTRKQYETTVQTPGIVRCIWFNGRPAFIPEEQITAIQRFIEGQLSLELYPSTDIMIGDQVEIQEGPFRGIIGEVIQLRGQQRFVIRITALSVAVTVECEGWKLKRRANNK